MKTPELVEEFCRRIAAGRSVTNICKDEDMPEDRTIWRWLLRDEEFGREYARAVQARAMAHADRILDISQAVLAGKIPPEAARVALDGMKWTASRLLPKLYGDRQQVEATVTHTHTLHLEALKELADKARGTRSGYIEGQATEIVERVAFPGESAPVRQAVPRVKKPRAVAPIAQAEAVPPEAAAAAGGEGAQTPPVPPTGGGRVRARQPRSVRTSRAEDPTPRTGVGRPRGSWKKYKKEK